MSTTAEVSRNLTPLTLDEVKKNAPAAFRKKASTTVSKKYSFIPTFEIVDDMLALGYDIVEARQLHRRKNENIQKHMITFTRPELTIMNKKGQIEESLQIHLINSHDGRSRFLFQVSLYRLVCENGMLGIGNDFGTINFRHMGYSKEELKTGLDKIFAQLPEVEKRVKKMKSKLLSNDLKRQLAQEMAEIRFDLDDKTKNLPVDVETLITPKRDEDKGNDLWRVFNVIQEKLVKGGFSNDKNRKVRAIKNFESLIEVNEKLFKVAERFVNGTTPVVEQPAPVAV